MFLRRTLPLILAVLVLPSVAQEETAAQAVYSKVIPLVVVVRVGGGHGSGVIIGKNEVATNCHVVDDEETIVIYRMADEEPLAATLSRGDYGYDVCILSVPHLQNTQAVAIRKSKTLAVGEAVFAIGSPLGLDYTLSSGIISQLRGLGDTPPLIQTRAPDDDPPIQTDAAISGGSSGGGLFDANGNLVGLTTSGYDEGQNLNFAVPTEWLEEVRKKPEGEVTGKDERAEAGASVVFLDHALELQDAGDWQGMFAHCRLWAKIEPWNDSAWFYLGFAYHELGHYDDAITAYREALSIDSEDAIAWHNLGVAYGELERYKDEIAAYREALQIDPENADAWHYSGIAYGELGSYDDAIAAFHEALQIDPENADAWHYSGIAYGELGSYDDAIAVFHEALQIDPEDAVVWYNLGFTYSELGSYDDAIVAFREALLIAPEDADVWYHLGIAYGELERYDDRIAAYREALRINPEYADVWHRLGVAYRAQGRNAEADEAHQEYLRLQILSGE